MQEEEEVGEARDGGCDEARRVCVKAGLTLPASLPGQSGRCNLLADSVQG